ncbi:MAG: glycosyltransferase family 4 protein [Anaerolineaceae bacterium]
MKIGVLAYRMNYYTNLRIIVGKLPEAEYVPVKDVYSYRRSMALKLNHLVGKPLIPTFDLNNQFEDFDLNKVDLFHFSNGISYGKKPWVSSFETILPRFSHLVTRHQGKNKSDVRLDALTKHGLEALSGPACLQIIAWSRCAAAIQKDLLSEFSSEYAQPILAKMRVLQPPQEIFVTQKSARKYSQTQPIRFILVGAAFFRKGGKEILQAFEKLVKEEHLPIKLILVSSLRREDYAAHETEEDVAWAKQKISDNLDWIEYYPSLPNAQVIELLKGCDVGLLPSYADTYGLSLLEAQACGCPVVSTDIRALPEINNDQIGWLIKVPKNTLGEALYTTADERAVLSATIQTGLEEAVRQIVDDPMKITIKGEAAIARIREEHDPDIYAENLRQIYQPAFRQN